MVNDYIINGSTIYPCFKGKFSVLGDGYGELTIIAERDGISRHHACHSAGENVRIDIGYVLYRFNKNGPRYPLSGLVLDADEKLLYGTTSYGGDHNLGTIFTIKPDGSEFTIIHSFLDASVGRPSTRLIEVKPGVFYGTTGTSVYKIDVNSANKNLKFQVLHKSTNSKMHGSDYGQLVRDGDLFYGTAGWGGKDYQGAIYSIKLTGEFDLLHSFRGKKNVGFSGPNGPLVKGDDGKFYGTTRFGGANLGGEIYEGFVAGGTIFRFDPTTKSMDHVYYFNEKNKDINGYGPEAGLTLGTDGNFYGTTSCINRTCAAPTLFKFVPPKGILGQGILKTLHEFDPNDIPSTAAELFLGSDGKFYGTTNPKESMSTSTIYKFGM